MQTDGPGRHCAVLPAAAALLLALGAPAAEAVNTQFLEDSALSALTDADVTLLMDAIQKGLAAPAGEAAVWENPRTGASGRVEPGGVFDRDGRGCRHLRLDFGNRGRHGEGQWTYCRRTDGSWELMPK